MTTTFFLVRHAAHERGGTILCGRLEGLTLGEIGRAQAQRVSERLANENIACVRTSPLERARETANAIAARFGRPAEVSDEIVEIDFGAWTGLSFADLAQDPRWVLWNDARSVSRPPDGESMFEAQVRIVTAMEQLRRGHSGESVALVSHGDVIKGALLYHLGLPLDAYDRFDVDPASISTLIVGDWGSRILRLNEVVEP